MHTGLVLATSQGGAAFGNLLILLLPLLLLLFLFRSQRRRTREMANLQQSLVVGDEVVTTSGMIGRIRALTDDEAAIEIAPGVEARFDRRAVGSRRHAGPAPDSGPHDAPVEEH
ncbi:MAG: preprotein translocase subunit YajC [Dermatophilaceae bacterium]